MEDDDRQRKPPAHVIGEDLAALSIGELEERIVVLENEIARLRDAIGAKRASADHASSFFKS